jgi:hypothetical protein
MLNRGPVGYPAGLSVARAAAGGSKQRIAPLTGVAMATEPGSGRPASCTPTPHVNPTAVRQMVGKPGTVEHGIVNRYPAAPEFPLVGRPPPKRSESPTDRRRP